MDVLTIYGLKCDNPGCGFVDSTIQRKDYPNYIGFPCPKCGQSLLTQADYDAVVKLEKIAKNPLIKFMNLFIKNKCLIDFHGDGFKNMDISKVNDDWI